ncbi:hypothetical protein NDU88_012045 [Pleurodeles waltl]|uniref:Uncharacterized protein n=1 Tax=Pleurodeles waltl TaxID=8319 RepID=A0AAV7QZ18_PLEWA|nr:hypothetical protein NDU88_012045 [Pleurodeles waltl]
MDGWRHRFVITAIGSSLCHTPLLVECLAVGLASSAWPPPCHPGKRVLYLVGGIASSAGLSPCLLRLWGLLCHTNIGWVPGWRSRFLSMAASVPFPAIAACGYLEGSLPPQRCPRSKLRP